MKERESFSLKNEGRRSNGKSDGSQTTKKNSSGEWVENEQHNAEAVGDYGKVDICPLNKSSCSDQSLQRVDLRRKGSRKRKRGKGMNRRSGVTEGVTISGQDLSVLSDTNTKLVSSSKPKERKQKKKKFFQNEDDSQCKVLTPCEESDLSMKCLSVRAGFVWDATPDQLPIVQKLKTDDVSSEDEAVTEEHSKTKKKRLNISEKRKLARLEEERIRKIEERLMNAEKNPQSADDFDRLVMSAPNKSQNWIKYMAYHLEATEIGKARAVAERALKTISFREEQEKFNVWMALLNLENLFGTQESLEQTLQEAVQMNEPYKLYMQVLNMFSASKKVEELFKLVQLVIKKYKDNKETWIQAGSAYMKCGEVEKSRQLMQKSLAILDKKFHVEILSRFATLENEMGNAERAETIMENILTSYPKRVDVWNVYVDMLVKSNKLDLARQVLDRAVIQKLPASKMKSLFKKYMKFEQDHGTPEGVEKIREMAKKYVETVS